MIFPWFSHSKTPHSHYALPSLIPGSYFFEVFPKTFQDISSWRACVPTQDTQDRKLSCRRRFPSLPWEETLRCPPTLVKIQKTMEHHHLYIGKSTINGPFSIAVLNYQRVINPLGLVHWNFLCRSLQLWIYIYIHVFFVFLQITSQSSGHFVPCVFHSTPVVTTRVGGHHLVSVMNSTWTIGIIDAAD